MPGANAVGPSFVRPTSLDWNEAAFQTAYVRSMPVGVAGFGSVALNYHKASLWNIKRARAEHLVSAALAVAGDRVLGIGTAFGWMLESLLAQGVLSAVSVDTSAWVQGNKDLTEEASIRQAIVAAGLDPDKPPGSERLTDWCDFLPRASVAVLNADITKSVGRRSCETALGGAPDAIVFEDCCGGMSEAECVALYDACQGWRDGGARTLYLITVLDTDADQDANMTWLHGRDWKTLFPQADVIAMNEANKRY